MHRNHDAKTAPQRRKPGRPRKVPHDEVSALDCEVGKRLRLHRQQAQLSMRDLARRAGIAVSYLSNLEAGRISPSLAMLRKVLVALGSELEPFFANGSSVPTGHVFRRHQMRRVMDAGRSYTFILPTRPDIGLIMFDEELHAGENPEFESLSGDFGGYVLSGELVLEVQGEPTHTLQTGDAFFVPAGKPLRGWCGKHANSVRLVTVQAQRGIPPQKSNDGRDPSGNHEDRTNTSL